MRTLASHMVHMVAKRCLRATCAAAAAATSCRSSAWDASSVDSCGTQQGWVAHAGSAAGSAAASCGQARRRQRRRMCMLELGQPGPRRQGAGCRPPAHRACGTAAGPHPGAHNLELGPGVGLVPILAAALAQVLASFGAGEAGLGRRLEGAVQGGRAGRVGRAPALVLHAGAVRGLAAHEAAWIAGGPDTGCPRGLQASPQPRCADQGWHSPSAGTARDPLLFAAHTVSAPGRPVGAAHLAVAALAGGPGHPQPGLPAGAGRDVLIAHRGLAPRSLTHTPWRWSPSGARPTREVSVCTRC